MRTMKELRKAHGITQEQLAKMVGVTQGAVAQWETGNTHPTFEKLLLLAKALKTTVDDLITNDTTNE